MEHLSTTQIEEDAQKLKAITDTMGFILVHSLYNTDSVLARVQAGAIRSLSIPELERDIELLACEIDDTSRPVEEYQDSINAQYSDNILPYIKKLEEEYNYRKDA